MLIYCTYSSFSSLRGVDISLCVKMFSFIGYILNSSVINTPLTSSLMFSVSMVWRVSWWEQVRRLKILLDLTKNPKILVLPHLYPLRTPPPPLSTPSPSNMLTNICLAKTYEFCVRTEWHTTYRSASPKQQNDHNNFLQLQIDILLVVKIIVHLFSLYTTGAGCVVGTLAIMSPVCIVHNPVESIRINLREQIGSCVIMMST